MCTVILRTQENYPSIAEEDIVVYKKCFRNYDFEIMSPMMKFIYVKDIINEAKFTLSYQEMMVSDNDEVEYLRSLEEGDYCFVIEGFHSYKSIERMGDSNYYIPCKFIIPKGSLYYENECGNIVSNQIIFKEICV